MHGPRRNGVSSPTRLWGAGVAAEPAFGHAHHPGTIGTGVLNRDSSTGPPGMLSRLRGGPVFCCRRVGIQRGSGPDASVKPMTRPQEPEIMMIISGPVNCPNQVIARRIKAASRLAKGA